MMTLGAYAHDWIGTPSPLENRISHVDEVDRASDSAQWLVPRAWFHQLEPVQVDVGPVCVVFAPHYAWPKQTNLKII